MKVKMCVNFQFFQLQPKLYSIWKSKIWINSKLLQLQSKLTSESQNLHKFLPMPITIKVSVTQILPLAVKGRFTFSSIYNGLNAFLKYNNGQWIQCWMDTILPTRNKQWTSFPSLETLTGQPLLMEIRVASPIAYTQINKHMFFFTHNNCSKFWHKCKRAVLGTSRAQIGCE